MKIKLNNIENQSNGYIGTIIEKRYGRTNLLNHVTKEGNRISVESVEDQGPTNFTTLEFCQSYKNKNLITL